MRGSSSGSCGGGSRSSRWGANDAPRWNAMDDADGCSYANLHLRLAHGTYIDAQTYISL